MSNPMTTIAWKSPLETYLLRDSNSRLPSVSRKRFTPAMGTGACPHARYPVFSPCTRALQSPFVATIMPQSPITIVKTLADPST